MRVTHSQESQKRLHSSRKFSTSAWRLYAWRTTGGDLPVSGRTDAFHQEVNHLLQCLLQRQPATGSILVDQLI